MTLGPSDSKTDCNSTTTRLPQPVHRIHLRSHRGRRRRLSHARSPKPPSAEPPSPSRTSAPQPKSLALAPTYPEANTSPSATGPAGCMALSGRHCSVRAMRTLDPKRAFKSLSMKGRKAREGGLRLKTPIASTVTDQYRRTLSPALLSSSAFRTGTDAGQLLRKQECNVTGLYPSGTQLTGPLRSFNFGAASK
jgi:hypothetical protein